MYDCNDISQYQSELDAAGISRKDFDISNYSGLTARELRIITDAVIKTYGRKEGA